MATASESGALRKALAEPLTTFLIFGAHAGVDKAALQETFDRAVQVAQLTPDRWRTFLVRKPSGLAADLKSLIWPAGDTAPVVLLGIGAGLARDRVRTFQLADLAESIDILSAFTQGTQGA